MITHSDSIATLAPALVKAHAEVTNALKDSKNPHFGSTFASLNSVLDAVKPVYAKHGITFVQLPGLENGHATVDTMLVHESGEWIMGTSGAPLQKQDPQGVGSAITYLRRYSLTSLAGIGQEDDDGNAATHSAGQIEALVREVREMLEMTNGDIPTAYRKATEQAIDARDPARLEKARTYLLELGVGT